MPHSSGVIAASSSDVVLETNVITMTVGGTNAKGTNFDGFNSNEHNVLSDEGNEARTFGAVSPGAITVNGVDFPIELMMNTSGGVSRMELYLLDENSLLTSDSILSMSSSLGTVNKSVFEHVTGKFGSAGNGNVSKYGFTPSSTNIFGTVEGSTIVVTVQVAT